MGAGTSSIELLVGLACVAMAAPLWRRREPMSKAIAVLFVGAGLLAVVHAVLSLL